MCGAGRQPAAFFPAPLPSELEPPLWLRTCPPPASRTRRAFGIPPSRRGEPGPQNRSPPRPRQPVPPPRGVSIASQSTTPQGHRVLMTSSRREPPKLRRHAYVIRPASSRPLGPWASRPPGLSGRGVSTVQTFTARLYYSFPCLVHTLVCPGCHMGKSCMEGLGLPPVSRGPRGWGGARDGIRSSYVLGRLVSLTLWWHFARFIECSRASLKDGGWSPFCRGN